MLLEGSPSRPWDRVTGRVPFLSRVVERREFTLYKAPSCTLVSCDDFVSCVSFYNKLKEKKKSSCSVLSQEPVNVGKVFPDNPQSHVV